MATTEMEAPTRPEAGAARVLAISFDRTEKTTRPFSLADLERELADPGVFSWIDVQAASIDPLNDVLQRLGIDLVLTSHFSAPEILPRIVERPDCLAFYLYEVEDPEHHLDTRLGLHDLVVMRMILVLGADFVLTYHTTDLDIVKYVREQLDEAFRKWGKTQSFIAFLFLQKCMYDYAHLNLANDNFLDSMQSRVLKGDPDELAADISTAGGNIVTLKKLASSLYIVLMQVATKRSVFVSEEGRLFYREMLDSASAVRESIDSSRDLLDGITAGVQAQSAHRTSEIARVLTVVSSIILPLTLLTGIYGMNFEFMPELSWRWSYFVLLYILLTIGLTLLTVFWRLGWIMRGHGGRRK